MSGMTCIMFWHLFIFIIFAQNVRLERSLPDDIDSDPPLVELTEQNILWGMSTKVAE